MDRQLNTATRHLLSCFDA